MEIYNISIIGAGNMGSAIAKGLCGKGYNITVSNPHEEKLLNLKEFCGEINVTTSNVEAVKGADLIILAVKPHIIPEVVKDIACFVDFKHTITASLAASIDLNEFEKILNLFNHDKWGDSNPKIVKIMPNTAIEVCKSMTFMSSLNIPDDEIEKLKSIFENLGDVDVIPEKLMPAATALCSCGIAFAFRYIRANIEGAVELGIKPKDALRYEIETLRGACELLSATMSHPEAEIDKVTTAGGITIKGLNAMEKYGFSTSVIEGLKATIL